MSTKYFNLPYIDPTAPFDGAVDINKLADAVDSALETVEVLGRDATFTLEPATRTKLGGVIVGNGVDVGQDGTISVNVDPYELPPATHSALGGVIVGNGINVTPDGIISIDDAAITLPPNSVGTEQILDNAVTAPKIANKTITFEKLAGSMQDLLNEAVSFSEAKANEFEVNRLGFGNENTLKMFNWGMIYTIWADNATFTSTGGSTFDICNFRNTVTQNPLIQMNKVFCEIFKEGVHQEYGVLEMFYNRVKLYSRSALSAGDYTLKVFDSFYWSA